MLVIFDKDGTLINNFDARPANKPEEQVLLPGVYDKCMSLLSQGNTLAIASNQGGVAWDYIEFEEAEELMEHAAGLIGVPTRPPDGKRHWIFCPHHPDAPFPSGWDCPCRKPKPGMIRLLMSRFGYTLYPGEVVFVGDQATDRQAAEAAGVKFVEAKEFFG